MHNWLEGVLQHHLRILWGIGRPTKRKKGSESMEVNDEEFTEAEMSESASELEDLYCEEMEYQHSSVITQLMRWKWMMMSAKILTLQPLRPT